MKVFAVLAILCLFLVACSAPAEVEEDVVVNDSEMVDDSAYENLAAIEADIDALAAEAEEFESEDFDFEFE